MSGPLDEYRAKRDFARTPEPAPAEPRPGEGTFVIHRHEARRLHYDLRLAMQGVLKSWAVPKGFSYRPEDKHLAVRTEDHPIEYETFHGMIPKGEYGAGTMTIWDHGHYRVLTDGDWVAATEAGKLEIEVYGRRVRGEWHLVRTKQNWLIFKARDHYAAAEGVTPLDMDLSAAAELDLPGRAPRRMLTGDRGAPFTDPGWLFELDVVGRRVFAAKRGDEVQWLGAAGRGLAAKLPELTRDLRRVRAQDALLDGVLAVTDAHGRPSAAALEAALRGGGDAGAALCFYAFDLLHYDRFDLRALPLLSRKAALVAALAQCRRTLFVDHVAGSGLELAQSVAAAGLPGMIAKRGTGVYAGGASRDWRRCAVTPAPAAADRAVEEALQERERTRDKTSRVALSNLEKVYWPKEGYTKGDLLLFYEQVTDVLLPLLHERPVHLYRWPDGIEGKNFYQHNAPDGVPDWVVTESIQRRHKETPVQHIVCNDRDTLLYLINLGSIDLHPWMSRRGSLESPDYAVIDFDPKDAPFDHVVRLARETGKLLRGIGLRPLLKTSGASGLHVHIPLVPGYTYEQARMFCEGVCRVIAKEHGDIATVERAIAQRGRRVYLDFGQNRRGQTVVPAYAVRPQPGATVSTPLDWDELTGDLHPSLFTIHTVPARLAQRGDLARPLLEDRQDLMPAIAALQDALGG
ncbi:MAG: non-homologous end-joining DNA ligase [Planctomycetota bacterium]